MVQNVPQRQAEHRLDEHDPGCERRPTARRLRSLPERSGGLRAGRGLRLPRDVPERLRQLPADRVLEPPPAKAERGAPHPERGERGRGGEECPPEQRAPVRQGQRDKGAGREHNDRAERLEGDAPRLPEPDRNPGRRCAEPERLA